MTHPLLPTAPDRSDAILLLAYGGPDSLDAIPAFLLDVRGGRPAPPPVVAEITRRYRLIGGRSPLPALTARIAARLAERLSRPVYVGMRHSRPTILAAVTRMAADGIRGGVALCLAPHCSALSIGAYRARLDEALAAVDAGLALDFVESWHVQAAYLDGIAAHVKAAFLRFSPSERDAVTVIFTAHSLPTAAVAESDPYPAQLQETAARVTDRLGLPADRWQLAYQSAPRADAAWLGPQIEALVPQLAAAGERNLLIAPIGFVSDNVEVLYDLDIALQGIAQTHGVHLERAAMLNDSPALIAALVSAVRNTQHATRNTDTP